MTSFVRYVPLAIVATFSAVPSAAEDHPQKIKPVMIWKGLDSKQTKESFARCTTQEEWAAVWLKHCGVEKERYDVICPQVNFDHYIIVVLFGGESGQNSGIRFQEVVEDEKCIRVRYQDPFGQVIIIPTDDGVKVINDTGEINSTKKQNNFLFLVLAKSKKPIAVEQDVRREIGKPAEWKERARFP